MKIGCIIQARSGSTRLPNKILMKIQGKETLILEVERLLNSDKIDQIIVATTDSSKDDKVESLIKSYANPKVSVFRGSEEDVLDRYYQAAKKNKIDIIIRITGDCPLIDWEVVNHIVDEFLKGDHDYASNVLTKRTYPRGLDTEVFNFKSLELMWKNCKDKREREHVTTYIRENPNKFKTKNVENKEDLSNLRWTLDENEDFILIKEIFDSLYPKNNKFNMKDILKFLKNNPNLSNINKHIEQKKNIKNEAN